jgi:hypothetical protein
MGASTALSLSASQPAPEQTSPTARHASVSVSTPLARSCGHDGWQKAEGRFGGGDGGDGGTGGGGDGATVQHVEHDSHPSTSSRWVHVIGVESRHCRQESPLHLKWQLVSVLVSDAITLLDAPPSQSSTAATRRRIAG